MTAVSTKVSSLSGGLAVRLRGLERSLARSGWRVDDIFLDQVSRRVSMDFSTTDGVRVVVRGTFDRAWVVSEHHGITKGPRVGSGNWRPDRVTITPGALRFTGHLRDVIKTFAQYATDNPALLPSPKKTKKLGRQA